MRQGGGDLGVGGWRGTWLHFHLLGCRLKRDLCYFTPADIPNRSSRRSHFHMVCVDGESDKPLHAACKEPDSLLVSYCFELYC